MIIMTKGFHKNCFLLEHIIYRIEYTFRITRQGFKSFIISFPGENFHKNPCNSFLWSMEVQVSSFKIWKFQWDQLKKRFALLKNLVYLFAFYDLIKKLGVCVIFLKHSSDYVKLFSFFSFFLFNKEMKKYF